MQNTLSWRYIYTAVAHEPTGDIEFTIRPTHDGHCWLRASKRISDGELFRSNSFTTPDEAMAAAVAWLATLATQQGEKVDGRSDPH